MADEASILRVAQAERDHLERLLAVHVRACRRRVCPECQSLTAHLDRAQRRAELLASAAPEMEMEALFGA